jgi:hypothetical protein
MDYYFFRWRCGGDVYLVKGLMFKNYYEPLFTTTMRHRLRRTLILFFSTEQNSTMLMFASHFKNNLYQIILSIENQNPSLTFMTITARAANYAGED